MMPLASQPQVMQSASTLLRALHVCWPYHHVHNPAALPLVGRFEHRGVWLHRLAQVLPDTCGMCHVTCLASEHVVLSRDAKLASPTLGLLMPRQQACSSPACST